MIKKYDLGASCKGNIGFIIFIEIFPNGFFRILPFRVRWLKGVTVFYGVVLGEALVRGEGRSFSCCGRLSQKTFLAVQTEAGELIGGDHRCNKCPRQIWSPSVEFWSPAPPPLFWRSYGIGQK